MKKVSFKHAYTVSAILITHGACAAKVDPLPIKDATKLEEQSALADYPGTGISSKNDYLYASSNDDVYRYKLNSNGEVIHPNQPEKICSFLRMALPRIKMCTNLVDWQYPPKDRC